MNIYDNLRKKDIKLPVPSQDTETISMVKRLGDHFLYISGMGPAIEGKVKYCGRVPCDVSTEEAKEAAGDCARNILAAIEKEVGDLNKVRTVVKLLVFVASETGYNEQHIVANGASDIFISAFGEHAGKSARSAIGVAELPLEFPVEVEALIELKA